MDLNIQTVNRGTDRAHLVSKNKKELVPIKTTPAEIKEQAKEQALVLLDRIGLKHNVPQGTYFVMIDIQEFLDLPQFAGYTDLEFCEWMIKNVGVAAVPGSSFFKEGVNHLIRLHFARTKDTIDEAINRLAKLKELV